MERLAQFTEAPNLSRKSELLRAAYAEVRGYVNSKTMGNPLYETLQYRNQELANIVRQAREQEFSNVIYPKSGLDVSSAAVFSDTIITIDSDAILHLNAGNKTNTEVIDTVLEEKTHRGYYGNAVANLGIVAYLTELALLRVNEDSITVKEDSTTKGVNKTIITFTLENGRQINHTHYAFNFARDRHTTEAAIHVTSELHTFVDNNSLLLDKGIPNTLLSVMQYINPPSGATILTDSASKYSQGFKSIRNMNINALLDALKQGIKKVSNLLLTYGYSDIDRLGIVEVI